MKYEKPTIRVVGNAQALVLGTKGETPLSDSPQVPPIHSMNAYEADE
jgi:hypothetical protein